jgi:hypothetical protein
MYTFSQRFGAAILVVALGACSQNTIKEGDTATVGESFTAVMSEFSESPALAKGYANALYRAVVLPEPFDIADDFDPEVPLPLATDRPAQPAAGSAAYIERIQPSVHRVAGLDPQMVVDLYVSQDSGALSRQEGWIRHWQAQSRIRARNSQQEVERRRGLLDRFRPIRPTYFWDRGRPYLKLTMFNPLDVPLDRVALDVDLYDPKSPDRLGTASVQGILTTALQPGSEATLTIDLSQYEGLNRPQFRALPDAYRLRIAFRNAWSAQTSLIDQDTSEDKSQKLRNEAVADLAIRIRSARENLTQYRVLFDKGSRS